MSLPVETLRAPCQERMCPEVLPITLVEVRTDPVDHLEMALDSRVPRIGVKKADFRTFSEVKNPVRYPIPLSQGTD